MLLFINDTISLKVYPRGIVFPCIFRITFHVLGQKARIPTRKIIERTAVETFFSFTVFFAFFKTGFVQDSVVITANNVIVHSLVRITISVFACLYTFFMQAVMT